MIEKLGVLLSPDMFPSTMAQLTFAQGPKALVLDGLTRVYFSSRRPPIGGDYVSQIYWVDFSEDFSQILGFSGEDVVKSGELGSFDEHGIFPLEVLEVGDELLGFSGGWSRRESVSIDMAIGLLYSSDRGRTFGRVGKGPVLSGSPSEPFLVGDPCVVNYEGLLHLFYISGTHWERSEVGTPERTYLISHRISLDGRSWSLPRSGPLRVVPPQKDREAQAMPSIALIGETWVMVFSYRDTFGFRDSPDRAYRLGLATSNDLNNWTRRDYDFGSWQEGWDVDMMAYPNIHVRGDHVIVLYNGNQFGREGFGGVRLPALELLRGIS